MKNLWIEKEFAYDGTQLRSLYAYLNWKIQGDSVVSWMGPCNVPAEHMVDGEDLLLNAEIRGDKMVHFIVELFDRELYAAVSVQRLMAAIVKDWLQEHLHLSGDPSRLRREGDDLYLGDAKLSISIATRSPVSVMIHFAVNVANSGTPVKTLSLEDLNVSPVGFSKEIMQNLCTELESIRGATQKVRPIP